MVLAYFWDVSIIILLEAISHVFFPGTFCRIYWDFVRARCTFVCIREFWLMMIEFFSIVFFFFQKSGKLTGMVKC